MTQASRAWGIVPAAGRGSRIQPLGFSKELLPVVGRIQNGGERPRAVSEYLVERMVLGGANRICFVIAAGKLDILQYFGATYGSASTAYVVQPSPAGLCDAIFRAEPLIADDDQVLVGLPDTIWFPDDALRCLPDDRLSFLLFPVQRPELFDAVVVNDAGNVSEIRVKSLDAVSSWVWGAFKMPGSVFRSLHRLWMKEERRDEYVGTLVNAYLAAGGRASGLKAGTAYADVGTLDGYRTALDLLARVEREAEGLPREVAGQRRRADAGNNAMVR
jgi:glucose-1-phosphate thymidylyltransferase